MLKSLLILFFIIAAPAGAFADGAKEKAAKFLDAMGGAGAWKDARYVHNWSVNWFPERREGPYTQEYWYDLQHPGWHITLTSAVVDLQLIYNAKAGRRVEGGIVTPMTPEILAGQVTNWGYGIYRKIWLLANDHPDLVLEEDNQGRVHFTLAADYLGWIEFDGGGAPLKHGVFRDRDNHVSYQPLRQFGDVSWVAGGTDNEGWRFEVLDFEVSTTAPVDFGPQGEED